MKKDKVVSKCCKAPVEAVGAPDFIGSEFVGTMHYECKKCGKPCDVNKVEEKKFEKYTKMAVLKLQKEFLEQSEQKCAKCPNTKNLTLDHIIPVSILRNLNIDPAKTFDKKNLQVLCYACNQMKGHELDFINPKTKKLLLEYLKEL